MSDVHDKIRKLLALAASDNIHEAAAAASRAQALIDEHRIDMALLETDGHEPEHPREAVAEQTDLPLFAVESRLPTWRWSLAWRVAEANACKPWSEMLRGPEGFRRTIYLVGRLSDAAHAGALFAYLDKAIDAAARKEGKGLGKTWLNNFRMGAVSEVGRRLAQQISSQREALEASAAAQDVAENTTTALVRVQRALARFDEAEEEVVHFMKYNKMTYSGSSSFTADEGAFQAGRKTGASLSLGSRGRRALGGG